MEPNRIVAIAVMLVVGLMAGRVEAQTCSTIFNDMKTQAIAGKAVYVSFSTSQANKISTSTFDVRVVWDSVNSILTSFPYPGHQGPMSFNDRNNASYSGQNFSTVTSQMEDVDLDIKITGTVTHAQIKNLVWGNYLNLASLECVNLTGNPSEGYMYGFGDPIGNWNGSNKAMYVFTYRVVP